MDKLMKLMKKTERYDSLKGAIAVSDRKMAEELVKLDLSAGLLDETFFIEFMRLATEKFAPEILNRINQEIETEKNNSKENKEADNSNISVELEKLFELLFRENK